MAEVTQLKRYDARPINWGKWFLIGTGMLVSAFILLVPMIYIFVQAFSKGLMPVLQNLADPDMLHAIWLRGDDCADCRTGKPGVRHSAGLAGDAL